LNYTIQATCISRAGDFLQVLLACNVSNAKGMVAPRAPIYHPPGAEDTTPLPMTSLCGRYDQIQCVLYMLMMGTRRAELVEYVRDRTDSTVRGDGTDSTVGGDGTDSTVGGDGTDSTVRGDGTGMTVGGGAQNRTVREGVQDTTGSDAAAAAAAVAAAVVTPLAITPADSALGTVDRGGGMDVVHLPSATATDTGAAACDVHDVALRVHHVGLDGSVPPLPPPPHAHTHITHTHAHTHTRLTSTRAHSTHPAMLV
jgi:hypothetical protein